MASLFLASNLTSWYNRINGVRNRTNISLGSISVPNVQNTTALATHISNVKTAIDTLKSNTYLKYATYTTTDNLSVSSGDLFQESQKTAIESTLTSLETICGNTYSTPCSDVSYNDSCSNNSRTTGDDVSSGNNITSDSAAGSCDHTGLPTYSRNGGNGGNSYLTDGYKGNCQHSDNISGYQDKICNQCYPNCNVCSACNKCSDTSYSKYGDYSDTCSNNYNASTGYNVTGNSYTG